MKRICFLIALLISLVFANMAKAQEGEYPDLVPLLEYNAFKKPGDSMTFEIGALNDGKGYSKLSKLRFRLDLDPNPLSLDPLKSFDIEELLEVLPLPPKQRSFTPGKLWNVTAGPHMAELCVEEVADTVQYTHVNNCVRIPLLFPKQKEDQNLPFEPILKVNGAEWYPEIQPKKLNVVFVASNYSRLEDFENVANTFQNALLALDPFNKRSQVLQFHVLPEIFDLKCENDFDPAAPMKPLQVCKNQKVLRQRLTKAKIPFDKIALLGFAYHGGHADLGGSLSYTPTVRTDSKPIFIHEFAHTLGLLDEYLLTDNERKDYFQEIMGEKTSVANCSKVAQCPDWKNIEGAQCIPGCGISSWYRSSEQSVMNRQDLSTEFNAVSKKHLEHMLDLFSLDSENPQISLQRPKEGEKIVISPMVNQGNLSSTMFIQATVKDNMALARAELYLDDKLMSIHGLTEDKIQGLQKEMIVTFMPDFTGVALENTYTFRIKVYDLAGNSTESASVKFSTTSFIRDQYETLVQNAKTFKKEPVPEWKPEPVKPMEAPPAPKLSEEQLKKYEEDAKKMMGPPALPPSITKKDKPPPKTRDIPYPLLDRSRVPPEVSEEFLRKLQRRELQHYRRAAKIQKQKDTRAAKKAKK